eukprot:6179335-Pleurochrysis_carterae.AAC.1
MSVAFTWKGAGWKLGAEGRYAVGLSEWFKYSLNQSRNDPDLAGLDLHAAERKLLLKWGSVPFSEYHFVVGIHIESIIS